MTEIQPPHPTTLETMVSLIGPVTSAAVGVFMRYGGEAQKGRPMSFKRLAFELPSVIGLGIMGGALGDWLGGPELIRWALPAVLGYMGPKFVEAVVYRWLSSAKPKND